MYGLMAKSTQAGCALWRTMIGAEVIHWLPCTHGMPTFGSLCLTIVNNTALFLTVGDVLTISLLAITLGLVTFRKHGVCILVREL